MVTGNAKDNFVQTRTSRAGGRLKMAVLVLSAEVRSAHQNRRTMQFVPLPALDSRNLGPSVAG
jgi:hypothetical protein